MMQSLPRTAWVTALRAWPRTRKGTRLEAVTMEVGQDDALIVAAAYANRRVRLAFGTGEEFVGGYQDLPARIGEAARHVLAAAAPLVDQLPRRLPDGPPLTGNVAFVLSTARAQHAHRSRISELREGRATVAPLWAAFSDLLEPMLVALFPRPSARARPDIPGLTRARQLWGRWRDGPVFHP